VFLVAQGSSAGVTSHNPDAAYDLRGSSRRGWRGRAREWQTVTRLLRAARHSRGGVLLVEGRFGTGKTRLLDQVAGAAADRGFTVVRGMADESSRLMPLAALMSALGDSIQRLQAAGRMARSDAADLRLWLLEQVQDRLEQQAARGPVLVTLDDLHWADPTTLLALRSLIPELSSYPLVWVLSRLTGEQNDDVERLFERLERDGAVRLVLAALDQPAVAEIVTDVLGARPGPDLLALTTEMGDNPFVLVELLTGLRDEGAVEVVDGRVRLVSRRVPQRVQQITRRALAGLSPETRSLLRVAAVLGRSFPVDDLADMLGEPASRLLPALEEAEQALILVPEGEMLTFRHDVLWRSVLENISEPARRALHRQAGQMLLTRGGSAVPAATHLMLYARPGDRQAMAGLARAAQELLISSPQTAADLAVRALDITPLSDPDRFGRTVTAGYALTTAGRLSEAIDLIHRALDEAALPAQVARLRCELGYVLYLAGDAAGVVAEAESVLAQRDLSDELRSLALNLLFRGLLASHDFRTGPERAEAVLAGRPADDPALVGAHMLLSYLCWAQGHGTEALAHVREAVRVASVRPIESHRSHPRLQLAVMLMGLGRFEEAEGVLYAAAKQIATLGHTAFTAGPALFRAQLRLAEGRLDDAVAEAQAGLAVAEGMGAHAFSLVGLAVLAIVAVRRGDLDAAAGHVEQFRAHQASGHGVMLLMAWGNWGLALVAEARGDAETAVAALRTAVGDEMERGWLLMTDGGAAAWLTRVALAVGDRSGAEAVVRTAERLAGDNLGFPALAASAAHARGLLRGDAESLARAATTHVGAWNRASAAEDLGVLIRTADRAGAVRALDRALEEYQRIGALRDAARVRARLRALGVHRRHDSRSARPVSGWESLTDTERNVAALVAQGLTNPQVAARMYVSPHTVKFHLRQVFRKLGIGSRVELARSTAEHGA
jgi:DNA-binding CsgD family transcriptional regulator